MPAGATAQLNVLDQKREGVAGMPVYVGSPEGARDWLINTNPQAVEVWTLQIDTATDSETYGVNLTVPAVESVSFTAGVGTSATLIAEGLVAAWNTTPQARAFAKASNVAGLITFTGTYPGIVFTLAEDENAAKMTLLQATAAASAAAVPFGRAMIVTGFGSGPHDKTGVLAATTSLSARVSTLTVTYAAGETYTVSITVEGKTYIAGPVAANTDDDTTAADIEAAIDLIMPANTVDASVATNVVTLTAEVPGKFFEVSLGLASGTTSRLVLADTLNTPACDFNAVFGGVAMYTDTVQSRIYDADAAEWPPNHGVEVMRSRPIWVESSESPAYHAKVYVELAVGATAGRFYTASSATRVLVDPSLARWHQGSATGSDAAVAALSLSLGA